MVEKKWHIDFFAKIKPNEKLFSSIKMKEKNKYYLLRLIFSVGKWNVLLYRWRSIQEKKTFMKVLWVKKSVCYNFLDDAISNWYILEYEWRFYINTIICDYLAKNNKFLYENIVAYNQIMSDNCAN